MSWHLIQHNNNMIRDVSTHRKSNITQYPPTVERHADDSLRTHLILMTCTFKTN